MALMDLMVLILIFLISFSIRFGVLYLPKTDSVYLLVFFVPFIGILIFFQFGLYRSVTRYVGFRALWNIVKAISLYSLILGVIILLSGLDNIPRSIILINWALLVLVICSLRLFARWILTKEIGALDTNFSGNKKRALIYGAGNTGVQLASALNQTKEYKIEGFIDDSKDLQRNIVWGLVVYSTDQIEMLVEKFKIDEVLVALPNISRARRFNIISSLEPYPFEVRTLPSYIDLAEGNVSVDDLKHVKIEDLLGRDPVKPNNELMSKNITRKIVMVTGAGGSIGSELCRQIIAHRPRVLILYEISELGLYNIEKELSDRSGISQVKIYPVLGSINNRGRLDRVLSSFNVNTLYHAAAYKHVPLVEYNSVEGIENNIFGTLNCAQASIENGVDTFVLVSTDKAVRPTNIMGATKRSAELILQSLSVDQKVTKFTMVRFGNVLDSSGSVIPLFKSQIKSGGPVTVTHKDVIRFFMTISEAVELVIQAGALGRGGDVFILDMGNPVSIDDLAKKMIKLSGLEIKNDSNPNGDIELTYTGLRPGEKIFEELLISGDTTKTENPRIMRAKEDMLNWSKLKPLLDSLYKEIINCNHEKIKLLLVEIVAEYKPQKKIADVLYNKGKNN